MPDIINSAMDRQAYAANTKGNLLAQVDKTIICISQGGMHTAGFSDSGKVLTIRCHQNNHTPDFFERSFTNEPLLSNTGKVAAVFVSSAKNIIVPKALYKEDVAAQWFHDIHFIQRDETISDLLLKDDKAYYLYTVPATATELIERYFPKAKIAAFAAHQFNKNYRSSQVLQCSISANEAYLTLYKDKRLHWHKLITFDTVEDIAYCIKQLCMQQNIHSDELPVICAIGDPSRIKIINSLAQYFPSVSMGTGKIEADDAAWQGPVYLFQQLYACVS